jgi:uncharacterized protein (TIGR00255 family)
MPRSMTGFARVETETATGTLAAEARSLNSRYLELSLRLPRAASSLEQRVRELVKRHLKRGRVEVSVKWDRSETEFGTPTVNEDAIAWYVGLAGHLKDVYKLKGDLTVETVMGFKDIITYEEKQIDEDALFATIEALLQRLNDDRAREGALIRDDLLGRITAISSALAEVELRWPEVIRDHEQSLRQKIAEVTAQVPVDEMRILQEIAIYMERLDIAEEISRLKGHLDHFRATVGGGGEIGRKLDFLIQEMVRETNTIASKSNDLAINERVIKMKVETEKLREQVQNLE